MISIIAAIGKNNELGKDNKLIWHLKKDLEYFKKNTWGKKIVMGAKTYYSLPKKLENRSYIVLSKSIDNIENGLVFHDFLDLLSYLKNMDEEVMIIGGASIYKMFLPYADKLYLTEIDASSDADAYFPSFLKSEYKKTIIEEVDENIKYRFVLYERL